MSRGRARSHTVCIRVAIRISSNQFPPNIMSVLGSQIKGRGRRKGGREGEGGREWEEEIRLFLFRSFALVLKRMRLWS